MKVGYTITFQKPEDSQNSELQRMNQPHVKTRVFSALEALALVSRSSHGIVLIQGNIVHSSKVTLKK